MLGVTITSSMRSARRIFTRCLVCAARFGCNRAGRLRTALNLLKKPDIIKEMTSRTPRKSFEVYSTSDSVRIELYDNGVFDYDSVSVIYNKQLVIYKKVLQTNKPISFY